MTTQSAPALRVENAFKVFGRRPQEAVKALKAGQTRKDVEPLGTAAVIDASFEVFPGEIFVVMGLSGSGKSTLIRMLNGLLPMTSGSVLIGDTDIARITGKQLRNVRQKSISMVFQHFALLPHRTVLENAAYGLEIQGVGNQERTERATTMLETVGLAGWGAKYPDQLSGGMKQRVGLARALCAETDILLMDEAFSALDPLIRRDMQVQLVSLQADLGKTIIFITHDLNEAMFLGDRIAVMKDGEIVQIGTPDDILTHPANDYVAAFIRDVDRTRVLTAGTVMENPRAVVTLHGGARAALLTMRQQQTSGAFVIDRQHRFRGIVTDRETMALIDGGGSDLALILTREADAVSKDTALNDLFGRAVESSTPLPVVDSEDRLVGAVARATLLAALGNVPSSTNAMSIVASGQTAGNDNGSRRAATGPPVFDAAMLEGGDPA
ncbi:glycine betaine/proline transport system ATP-binding protein [Paeniglutamicibacter cryotolerans]|uniref:Glycine betaine/proline transport system ATP-binding protein n=2 Tax=Paeniglutamicibacter cryotolerans TaxID=670079 RepID=A0A839QFD1_9MICC|nr:glycine betaine/L-proline ABC transporter ATP-binding protein [Paeniglutamicibacter cryotolerans]MBB2994988.1 glycine betaine/proline transport system ATP-binding protein [Paeniglutamicibacter cryotolerans]